MTPPHPAGAVRETAHLQRSYRPTYRAIRLAFAAVALLVPLVALTLCDASTPLSSRASLDSQTVDQERPLNVARLFKSDPFDNSSSPCMFETHMRETWALEHPNKPFPESLADAATALVQTRAAGMGSCAGASCKMRGDRRVLSSGAVRRALQSDVGNANGQGLKAPRLGSAPSQGDMNQTWYRWDTVNAPRFVDWRAATFNTEPWSQNGCESCWVLAGADLVSMLWALAVNIAAVPLSPQHVCDCGTRTCCKGGWPEWVFMFARSNNGLAPNSIYPYQAADGDTCAAVGTPSLAANVSGWEKVPSKNPVSIMRAVAQHPVLVYISAESDAFVAYSGGMFWGECGNDINHAMVVMGYNLDAPEGPFWILKNTWGAGWGEGGYMRLPIIDNFKGRCAVHAESALYPTFYSYSAQANPCNVRPQPCGRGTCYLDASGSPRCLCPPGSAEKLEASAPKCVSSDPCDSNPNPCGRGACSNQFDGTYTCACKQGSVIGARADGAMTCVVGSFQSGLQTHTVMEEDTCESVASRFNLSVSFLESKNPFLDCLQPTIPTGYVLLVAESNFTRGCATTDLVRPADSCAAIASRNSLSPRVLLNLNPGLDCGTLKLSAPICVAAGNLSATSAAAVACGRTYTVRVEETCADVLANANTSLADVIRLNPGIDCSPGVTLVPAVAICVAPLTDELVDVQCVEWYTIGQGDTCVQIANAAQLTMAEFFKINPGIRCHEPYFQIGQRVCVVGTTLTSQDSSSRSRDFIPYIVSLNDTLASISASFLTLCPNNTFPSSICEVNTLPDCSDQAISPGQVLLIPCIARIESDNCPAGAVLKTNTWVCGSDSVSYQGGCAAAAAFAQPYIAGACAPCENACRARMFFAPLSDPGCSAPPGVCPPPRWNLRDPSNSCGSKSDCDCLFWACAYNCEDSMRLLPSTVNKTTWARNTCHPNCYNKRTSCPIRGLPWWLG